LKDFYIDMAIVGPLERLYDLGVQGNFGRPWELGQKVFGYSYYGEEEIKLDNKTDPPLSRWGVYQRRHSFWKIVDGKRKFFGPIKYIRESFMQNDQHYTPAREANETKFRNGMSAWALLTSEQKTEYNIRGNKIKLHGVNLFLRNWLKSH